MPRLRRPGAAVTAGIITPGRAAVGRADRAGCPRGRIRGRPLGGGNVADRVEQVTLHLTGDHDPLELVRKEVPAYEIAGLRAAQAVRPDATAIPELVAWGTGWLITPLAPGSPLARGNAVPANLPDTLAALHARYHGGVGLPAAIPRVTPRGGRRCAGNGSIRGSASTPRGTRRRPPHGPGRSSAGPPAFRRPAPC